MNSMYQYDNNQRPQSALTRGVTPLVRHRLRTPSASASTSKHSSSHPSLIPSSHSSSSSSSPSVHVIFDPCVVTVRRQLTKTDYHRLHHIDIDNNSNNNNNNNNTNNNNNKGDEKYKNYLLHHHAHAQQKYRQKHNIGQINEQEQNYNQDPDDEDNYDDNDDNNNDNDSLSSSSFRFYLSLISSHIEQLTSSDRDRFRQVLKIIREKQQHQQHISHHRQTQEQEEANANVSVNGSANVNVEEGDYLVHLRFDDFLSTLDALRVPINEKEANKIFSKIDKNKDGYIQLHQLITLTRQTDYEGYRWSEPGYVDERNGRGKKQFVISRLGGPSVRPVTPNDSLFKLSLKKIADGIRRKIYESSVSASSSSSSGRRHVLRLFQSLPAHELSSSVSSSVNRDSRFVTLSGLTRVFRLLNYHISRAHLKQLYVTFARTDNSNNNNNNAYPNDANLDDTQVASFDFDRFVDYLFPSSSSSAAASASLIRPSSSSSSFSFSSPLPHTSIMLSRLSEAEKVLHDIKTRESENALNKLVTLKNNKNASSSSSNNNNNNHHHHLHNNIIINDAGNSKVNDRVNQHRLWSDWLNNTAAKHIHTSANHRSTTAL